VRVKVLFFGVLKEVTGCLEQQIDLSDGSEVGAAFEHFARRFPRLAEWKASVVPAVNQHFSEWNQRVVEGDEIAFLPPVSGGAGFARVVEDSETGHFFALTREPIDARALAAGLLRGKDGAVVTFEGVVRDNTKGRPTLYLDYECYEPMAIEVMARLGREIAASHAISRIGMIHRLGRMEIGEASVVIVVTAPHRKPAFEAALEGINRLKRTVPIWKKEHFADGETWVDGEWDESVLKK
jgi:MoaE-MoaD fusion protein